MLKITVKAREWRRTVGRSKRGRVGAAHHQMAL